MVDRMDDHLASFRLLDGISVISPWSRWWGTLVLGVTSILHHAYSVPTQLGLLGSPPRSSSWFIVVRSRFFESSHSSVRAARVLTHPSTGSTSRMTASMPWMTPLVASMSGATTLLPAMRTSPSVVLSILMAWLVQGGDFDGEFHGEDVGGGELAANDVVLETSGGRGRKDLKSRRFRHEGCRGAYRAHP